MDDTLLRRIDDQRERAGFLGVRALLDRHGAGNAIPDPLSTLVGTGVVLGRGNRLYPGTVLEADGESVLTVGDGNLFLPGCCLRAGGGGSIRIGSGNQFGEGGFTATAQGAGVAITIGDRGRFMLGAAIQGRATLGDGSQILGPLAVQDCELGDGGDWRSPDPDRRGAVLKGQGRARGLRLRQGQVILGRGGDLEASAVEWQSVYHPVRG